MSLSKKETARLGLQAVENLKQEGDSMAIVHIVPAATIDMPPATDEDWQRRRPRALPDDKILWDQALEHQMMRVRVLLDDLRTHGFLQPFEDDHGTKAEALNITQMEKANGTFREANHYLIR